MTTNPRKGLHPLLVIGLGVIVILSAIYWLVATGPIIEGQQGKIIGGEVSVLAAADETTFNQMGAATTAQLSQWQTEGKVLLLPVGTRVLVLDCPRHVVR